jgi:hypothetical protein
MKDAVFMIPRPALLAQAVDMLNDIPIQYIFIPESSIAF